jgi:hypothetical protein
LASAFLAAVNSPSGSRYRLSIASSSVLTSDAGED